MVTPGRGEGRMPHAHGRDGMQPWMSESSATRELPEAGFSGSRRTSTLAPALAAEPALAKDWLTPEEDAAWAGL